MICSYPISLTPTNRIALMNKYFLRFHCYCDFTISKNSRIVQQLGFGEIFVVDFDHTYLCLAAHKKYYSNLIDKKLYLERGIKLHKMVEILPKYYKRLQNSGWICFALNHER